MASVKGIGGAFIYSNDAARLAKWYRDMLGVETEALPDGSGYYRVFFTRDVETSVMRENPVFAIYKATEELAGSGRGFMLNLRVDNLAEFLEQLRAKGVKIEEKVQVWERGKHAWIMDLDGNRVELYEEILVDAPERMSHRQLLDKINQAYEDGPDAAEQSRLDQMRRHQRQIVQGEW